MTFSHEDQRPQVNTRLDRELDSTLDEFAEQHGIPKSEVMREALRDYLPVDEDEIGPRDPDLRETWRWLYARADERGRVPSTDAISDLAQQHSMNKEWIKHSKLRPLQRAGWIEPAHRWIIVRDPETDEQSDDQPRDRDPTQ